MHTVCFDSGDVDTPHLFAVQRQVVLLVVPEACTVRMLKKLSCQNVVPGRGYNQDGMAVIVVVLLQFTPH